MTERTYDGRHGRPVIDQAAVLAAMQEQIDDLAAAVAAQQATIDQLVAAQRPPRR